MPWAPKHPCAQPLCPALVERGERFCPAHRKAEAQRQDRRRGSAASRGYDWRWQKFRADYVRRHPLCVACLAEGRSEPATQVDHRIPVSGPDDPRFYDESNLQPLCDHHHSLKTAKEKGWGRSQR